MMRSMIPMWRKKHIQISTIADAHAAALVLRQLSLLTRLLRLLLRLPSQLIAR